MAVIKYHNYQKIRTISGGFKPVNTHLFFQLTTGFYFIDSADNKILRYSADEGENVSQIDVDPTNTHGGDNKSRGRNCVAAFHDRDNKDIYFMDWSGTQADMWKLDYTTSESTPIIVEYGSEAVDLYKMTDIFKIGTDVYVVGFDDVAGVFFDVYFRIWKFVDGNWNLMDSELIGETIAIANTDISFMASDGTDLYFTGYMTAQGVGKGAALYKYDVATTTLSRLDNYPVVVGDGWTLPTTANRQQHGVIYDSGTIMFTLYDESISKNVLMSYNIANDATTKGSEFTVALMLKRNSNSGNDPPFNRPKAFDVVNDANDKTRLYITSKRSGELFAISRIESTDNFGAISDTYVIDNGANLWKLVEFTSWMTQCKISALERGAWKCEIYTKVSGKINDISSTLEIFDGLYFKIIGSMTSATVLSTNVVIMEGYAKVEMIEALTRITIDSPAYWDLKNKIVSGSYSGNSSTILTAIAVASFKYVTAGTMSAGTAMGTIFHRGSKTGKTIINTYSQFEKFTWVIKPDDGQGLLNYNDGSIDSGVNVSETDKISNFTQTVQRSVINQMNVKGMINPVTGIPYTGTYNNTQSQQLYGVIPGYRTFAHLTSDAQCLAQATAMVETYENAPFKYKFTKAIGDEGLVLPSEEITFVYAPQEIASAQRIITKVTFWGIREVADWEVVDALFYRTTQNEQLKEQVQENNDYIEQVSAIIQTDKVYRTGWDIINATSRLTLSFVNGTRTFTITPSADIDYFVRGARYTFSTAKSVIITDTEGKWFIYLVGTTLTASQAHWDIQAGDKCMVAIIHWNAAGNTANLISWECHGWNMDGSTHARMHEAEGCRYDSRDGGLDLTDGANPGQIAITAGALWDEDINVEISSGVGGALWEQDLADPAKIPVFYRDGASGYWRKVAATSYPFYDNGGADNVYYNQFTGGAWQRTELGGGKYTTYWIYGTPDKSEPILSIMGQVEWDNANAARAGATLDTLDWGTLFSEEFKVLYRTIVKADGTIDSYDDYRAVGTPGGQYIPPPTLVSEYPKYALIADEKDGNVAGGTFTSGAWRTRTLNTERYDPDNIVSLSSNRFTLIAGTYIIEGSAPAFKCENHHTRIYNVTDASEVERGTSERNWTGANSVTRSCFQAQVTIASAKAFEIQHYCGLTRATDGFGVHTGWLSNPNESVYTIVKITKMA